MASIRAIANKTVGVTTLIEVTPQPLDETTTEAGAEVAIPLGLQSLLLVVREPNRAFSMIRVGGRLRAFSSMWSRDSWSLGIVKKGLSWKWKTPPPVFKPFRQPQSPHLEEYVQDLLSAGAVEETSSILFQGPLFTVPKKNSVKMRVILDLSTLNQHIECPTFRMTTVRDVKAVIPPHAFTTSIDLKDAYWHIPVKPYYRKFLGFSLGGRKYRFRAMPFGLNIAPRIFTKLTKPILKELRMRAINVLVYLDDWLVWGDSVEECHRATLVVLQTLERRGFLINYGKSRLSPAKVFEWLGIKWDTSEAMLSLPRDKITSLSRDLSAFTRKSLVSRRQVERILGKLQFASLVDPIGKALLKNLNPFFRHLARKGLRDKLFPMPKNLISPLKRWLRPGILAAKVPFRPPPPCMDIYTDASNHGWGIQTSEGHHLQGVWSPGIRHSHINILELVAIYLALKRLPLTVGSHVRIHSDNSTAVNCLNRQGSTRSKPLNSWVLSILHLLNNKNLAISVFHIAGVSNVLADSLSRPDPVSSEWTLDERSFQWMCLQLGTPQVDMFATRYNARVPTFVSPVQDVEAFAINAFTQDWNQWSLVYAYPPTNMILRVLNHMEGFRGTVLLIAPIWPNQNWYPLLLARAKRRLVIPSPKLFQQIGGRTFWAESRAIQNLACWVC